MPIRIQYNGEDYLQFIMAAKEWERHLKILREVRQRIEPYTAEISGSDEMMIIELGVDPPTVDYPNEFLRGEIEDCVDDVMLDLL